MRVERLQREFEIEVKWHPYELHPELPPEGIDRGERQQGHPEGYVSPLRSLAEEAGLPFQPSRHVPNSHRSLEAAEFAREHGAFDSYHRTLFDGYFGRGRDIGDVSVLTELAGAVGLDAGALQRALESKRYASLVDERTDEAREMGVTGTPTCIFESGERRFALVGAQEYAVFEDIARRMGAAPRA